MLGFYSNNVKKELFGAPLGSNTGCSNSNPNKKVKNYSYNPLDRIGKGFSSIVYKGTNDSTSN